MRIFKRNFGKDCIFRVVILSIVVGIQCRALDNEIIRSLALQYLAGRLVSSIKAGQWRRWFRSISSFKLQKEHLGEFAVPNVCRCLFRQSCPVSSLNVATL